MSTVPHLSFRIATGLLAIATGSLTANAAADPYQVEVLVFAPTCSPVYEANRRRSCPMMG